MDQATVMQSGRAGYGPAEKNGQRPPPAIGFGGARVFNGFVTEEYLPELVGVRKVETYNRMRSDGQVEGVLEAIKAPICDATWTIHAAGTQRRKQVAADFVNETLGLQGKCGTLGQPWVTAVRKSLSYLDYGFQILVLNWEQDLEKNRLRLTELVDVHPRTILQGRRRWDFDDRGRLRGFWQTGYNGMNWVEEYIPITRCVHFKRDDRHGDPEGRAVLRSAYQHYYFKRELYRFDGIGHGRASSGVPVGKYPEGTDPTQLTEFEDSLKALQVCEAGFIKMPVGFELENFKLGLDTDKIMLSIDHHDAKIPLCVLAEWMNLGQAKRGSAPPQTSTDQINFFASVLSGEANYLAEMFNQHVVSDICGWNFPSLDPDDYPRVQVVVSRLSVFGFADAIRKLLGNQPAIWWQRKDQEQLRERFALPTLDPDAQPPAPPAPPGGPGGGGENNAGDQPNNPEGGASGQLPGSKNSQPDE